MDTYSYFTDGAATIKNENGKYTRKAGGWAFIRFKNGYERFEYKGGCPETTNNEMELYALYASLTDFLTMSNPTDTIEIYTDSNYCIDIFTKWIENWIKKGWKRSKNKKIENLKLIQSIYKQIKKVESRNSLLNFIKVEGHSNNVLNKEVDSLAVSAKKEAFKTNETIGYKSNKLI